MPRNTINSISPNLRDALLNRNLIPFTDISNASGLGLPTSIQLNFPLASTEVTTIDDNDDAYRDLNTILNPYKTTNEEDLTITTESFAGNSNVTYINGQYQAPDSIEQSPLDDEIGGYPYAGLKPISFLTTKNLYSDPTQYIDASASMYNLSPITDQIKSYLDERGYVRGIPQQSTSDIIGTLLSGRQLGYSPDGPEPNFDIRSSIVGRILAPTIGDTPLGLIGGQQLLNAMLANASYNVQQETIGRINLEGLFRKNEDFIVPDYEITVRDGFLGKAIDFWENLSGTQWPTSNIIKPDASIFTMDAPDVDAETRSQNLLKKYTGRGQVNALFTNLTMNTTTFINNEVVFRYTPFYEDDRIIGEDKMVNKFTYPTDEKPFKSLDDVSIDDSNKVLTEEKDDHDGTFTWLSDEDTNLFEVDSSPSPNILYKTQRLFNSGGIKSLVSYEYDSANKSEIQTNVVNIQGADSVTRGSNVLNEDGLPCRAWTTFKRYNQVKDLQKHRGLYQNPDGNVSEYARYRNNVDASVLDKNGFVKIAPYKDDTDIKKYMFSIENLAWFDNYKSLYPCERGNGDPTDTSPDRPKGRIMWFPPYGISFTDNTAVDWTSTKFIGRGEPIYTYNNTERSGTLTFQLIIDHASFMNEDAMKNYLNDANFASINAGCQEIPALKYSVVSEETEDIIEVNEYIEPEKCGSNLNIIESFKYYFPNNSSVIDDKYEDGTTENYQFTENGPFEYGLFSSEEIGKYEDTGLNVNSVFTNIDKIDDIINNNKGNVRVYIKGYASQAGTAPNDTIRRALNLQLSQSRAEAIKTKLLAESSAITEDMIELAKGYGETDIGVKDENQNSEIEKVQRYVEVRIINLPEKDSKLTPLDESVLIKIRKKTEKKVKDTFYSECTYFERLKQSDKVVYDNISNYIKNFHPAFHSTTPEGFNSRLTFLQQCTRQGPSLNAGEPSNLAFGRPPVCILRIGDFYHTRIIIDNVSFSFEPMTWDLNPEGVGVQPMIANVDITFKFIGGSSLHGPINKLQNAVSFNFFANTEIYDSRADTIVDGKIQAGFTIDNDITETKTNINNSTPSNSVEESAENADVSITNTTVTEQQFNSDNDEINLMNGNLQQLNDEDIGNYNGQFA